jgi:hypothetical protein
MGRFALSKPHRIMTREVANVLCVILSVAKDISVLPCWRGDAFRQLERLDAQGSPLGTHRHTQKKGVFPKRNQEQIRNVRSHGKPSRFFGRFRRLEAVNE